MYEKYLQDLGLSDKESILYLSLLAVDSSSVADLAEKTKIKRPTVYVILGSLQKKGLVSETTLGKKTLYQAEPPERLETYVERQKALLEEKSRRLKDIIPELKATEKEKGSRPIVKYFEGRDGVISMLEEMYGRDRKKGGVMRLIYPKNYLTTVFTEEEHKHFRALRLGHNIKSKVLYTFPGGDIPSDDMGERIKLDEKKYPVTCDISIIEDEVRVSVLGEKISGFFIKSKDFADTFSSIMDQAFDLRKKEGK